MTKTYVTPCITKSISTSCFGRHIACYVLLSATHIESKISCTYQKLVNTRISKCIETPAPSGTLLFFLLYKLVITLIWTFQLLSSHWLIRLIIIKKRIRKTLWILWIFHGTSSVVTSTISTSTSAAISDGHPWKWPANSDSLFDVVGCVWCNTKKNMQNLTTQ